MRKLDINDKCYKFFYSDEGRARRKNSRVYEKGEVYTDSKGLYFFRKDEAVYSLKNLIYFMGHGDTMAELVVNSELVEKTLEASPEHFCASEIVIYDTYNSESEEIRNLIMDALRNSVDFSIVNFKDILILLIHMKAFDSALYVYEKICEEKSIKLSKEEKIMIMEVGRQPWCLKISLDEVHKCEEMKEYIDFMKIHTRF